MPHFTQKVEPNLSVLGLDIAKDTIALHDSVSSKNWTIANTPAALKRALQPFAGHDLVVCEATGGYERHALNTACKLGLPIHRVDPSKAKAFISSHGGNAKTDKADAIWLARLGLERGTSLIRWSPPDPDREALTSLVRHRQDLLKERTQAKNRKSAPNSAPVADMLAKQINFLTTQIKELDVRIEALRKASGLEKVHNVLVEIPGIGPVVANAMIALMPELGQLARRQVASLAGLAPHPRDSGSYNAKRHVKAGRKEIKSVLFMAALSASRACPKLKPFYQRLIENGKPKMVALTAVARKLIVIANAKVRDAQIQTNQLT